MFKKTIFWITIIIMLFVLACSKRNNVESKYTGFTQINISGAYKKYFVDLKSLKLNNDNIQFTLLEELPDKDYIIRDVVTDCRSVYSIDSGTQYKENGTLYKNIQADQSQLKILGDPEMKAVI